MAAAKSATEIDNKTEAIKEFRKQLDAPSNYFNNASFPANETGEDAHVRCSTIEKAKKNCPKRWSVLEKWFTEARAVSTN